MKKIAASLYIITTIFVISISYCKPLKNRQKNSDKKVRNYTDRITIYDRAGNKVHDECTYYVNCDSRYDCEWKVDGHRLETNMSFISVADDRCKTERIVHVSDNVLNKYRIQVFDEAYNEVS